MLEKSEQPKTRSSGDLIQLDEDTVLCSISTFSGGGIGDAGVEWGCKVPVISACELVADRAGLIRHNYPKTMVFEGDIWELKEKIIAHSKERLGTFRPWLFVMSPPCQGMSSNGAGRLRASIKQGKRPKQDIRNRLVLPGIDIIEQTLPDWFVLENVQRMENTVIFNERDELENILKLIGRRLHPLGYTIKSSIIDFLDLGVPHHRKRLITIGCRIPSVVKQIPPGEIFQKVPSLLHPVSSHGGVSQPAHISMKEAIGHMPQLDALSKMVDEHDLYHQIPKWSKHHYFCLQHTPEGCSAFDNNTCIKCQFSQHTANDIDCLKCGAQLPKPQITIEFWTCPKCATHNRKNKEKCECGFLKRDDVPIEKKRRLIKGFKTAYRRLKWDAPASTLTMNSGVISSDNKGHPDQNRVLSVREIVLLSSLQAHPGVEYPWESKYQFRSVDAKGEYFYDGDLSPRLVRQVIGESIPPLAMYKIVSRLKELDPRIE